MSVRVATTANITLDNTTTTVDGVTLANSDLILVKNQTTGTQNGVYVVSTSGAWSRSALLATGANAYRATYIVTSGTVNGSQNFKCVVSPAIVDTNSLVFMAFDNALLNNLSATTNPAVTDDNTKGYSVGSVWINTTGNTVYTCTNSGTGVAVWTQGGTGDVVGPASSTANAISRYSGTTGKLIKDSSVTISDTSDLAGVKTLALSGSTSGALTVQTAATTTSYTITLPSAQGAANSFLQNNGSGTISWGDTAPKATNLTGTTTDTVPYQSASATTSYYTYNQLNGALTGASATQTIFVSNLNGSDTYNGLSPQTSVATLGKALTLVQSGGIIKVNRSGTAYSESVSITAQNITIMSDAYNGAVAFSGTITVANTASNVSMKGLSIATLNHTGAGALYMFNCTVTTAFSSSSSGYFLSYDSDFQASGSVTVSLTGTGTKIFGSNCFMGTTTINNASILVGINNINNSLAITLTAGILSINNGVVYSASAGANALSVASGAVAYLENTNFIVAGTTNPALINVASGAFYSELNTIRSSSSTISGTLLTRSPYFDALNSFNLALRGSTSGSLTVKPAATTTSYTITMPSAQGAASTVLQNDGSGGLSWATVTSGTSSSLVYAYYNASGGVDASNRMILTSTAVINTDSSQISVSGNIVTLAAGTWELKGFVQMNVSLANSADYQFYNETTSALVGNLVRTATGNNNSSGNLVTYTVTLASSTNFSFRQVNGPSGATPVATFSYLILEKKSSTPINPAPEYMVANLSTNQTTNVSSGDHIKFNGLWNGNMSSTGTTTTTNISLDTTTAYVTTNNVASIGRFTLAAARTYELTASLAATSGSGGFAWYNADTGTQLSNEAKLLDNLQCIAKAIVTPASNTRYEVRLTQTGPTTFHSSAAFAEVRIIGALPNGSNFSGATQSGPGSQGLVPAPAAAQQNYFLQGDGTWEPGVYTQTTVQRAASTPVTGLPFFNTTNRQLEYYNGTNYLTSSTVTITTTGQTGSLTDNLVIFNPPSSTALTYTLPDPTITYGKVITYRISSGATAKNSTVTLNAPSGATVNGAASFILACVGDFVTLTSSGTDWVVTNKPTGLLLIEDRTVSAQTNVTFDNVFAASKYNAYVIDVYLTNAGGSGGFANRWALRNAGATITTSTYQTSGRYQGPFTGDIQVNNQVAWYDPNFFNWNGAGDYMSITAEIRYPQSNTNLTTFQGQGTYSLASAGNYLTANIYTTIFGCEFRTIATTADGWIYLGQSGTVSGNIKVYARCV